MRREAVYSVLVDKEEGLVEMDAGSGRPIKRELEREDGSVHVVPEPNVVGSGASRDQGMAQPSGLHEDPFGAHPEHVDGAALLVVAGRAFQDRRLPTPVQVGLLLEAGVAEAASVVGCAKEAAGFLQVMLGEVSPVVPVSRAVADRGLRDVPGPSGVDADDAPYRWRITVGGLACEANHTWTGLGEEGCY